MARTIPLGLTIPVLLVSLALQQYPGTAGAAQRQPGRGTTSNEQRATKAYRAPHSRLQATVPDVFTQISDGSEFACALRRGGTAACWGEDSSGQAQPPTGAFTQISAGYDFACGLRPRGKVRCWGDDTSGQATPPSAFSFTDISAGSDFACGVERGAPMPSL